MKENKVAEQLTADNENTSVLLRNAGYRKSISGSKGT